VSCIPVEGSTGRNVLTQQQQQQLVAGTCRAVRVRHFAAQAVRYDRFVSLLNHYNLSTQVFWDVTLGRCFCVSWRFEGKQCLHLREDPLDIAKNPPWTSPKTPLGHRQNPDGQNPQKYHGGNLNSPIVIC